MAVELEWVGHACFRLTNKETGTIVMDPYDWDELARACGLTDASTLAFDLRADKVIVSSLTDKAHANAPAIQGDPQVINALDIAKGITTPQINGDAMVAVQAAEAPHHPEGPDDNALYAFKAGGLWFCHMGDLGYGIGADELRPFANRCDVLLALTGENLTLTLDDLDSMIEILKPKWIVPMHYNCPPITAGMTKIDVFLNRRKQDPVIWVRHHTVSFPLPAISPNRPTIVILEPSGYETSEKY